MKNLVYKICSRCIMDTSDPNIEFNDEGVCNHCLRYENELHRRVFIGDEASSKLKSLVDKIKNAGKGKEYDCIIGVSGGVDSTYVAYLTKQLGVRPLAVHFDNGWNSELAVSNIEKTLDHLGIDLYTYVIDWEEFKDLQLSFLKASTPDGEIPTDHAINALLFREADKRGIKYIINGMNFAAESISVPGWAYGHSDWKYIKSVQKIFGSVKLKRYPKYTFFNLFWWNVVKQIKVISILNYVDYKKDAVMEILQSELGWVYYGGKHYESVYTRFFQGYILPKKFGIDKRKAHLSDLIKSGQISRETALQEIEKPGYEEQLFRQDKDFVIKKFELNEASFDAIMSLSPKTFRDYPNNYAKVQRLKSFVNKLREKGLYSR
ncbi:MAG: N-acetyl sugar amidotransferase [Sediminibacterium sp.]|nr:N-acetyl sugar amidotransferase [Sediminibacterium sp.]